MRTAGLGGNVTGAVALARLVLRRDRVRLPVWVLAIVGLVGASAAAVADLYATPAAQAVYAATVGSSTASIAMNGPPTALDTVGGITVYEVTFTAVFGVALMAVFLTLRHTRTDEEAGRTELLRAGVMGRQADLLAVGLVVSAGCTLVGLGVSATFLAAGLDASGSWLYGASVAGLGWVFTGVALVAAQVTAHARASVGLALAVLGVAFVVRAVGDVAENGLSWASPIGWSQAVRAFGQERWWPLLTSLLVALALAGLAAWLTTRRDIGSGLVAPRPGTPTGSRTLATAPGLALRLQRTAVLGWTAGMVALGVAFGSLGEDVQAMIENSPEIAEIFAQTSGGATVVDAFFASVLLIAALVGTGFTVSSVLRLRSEEVADRAEPLLATPMSRTRWLLGGLSVTLGASTVVLLGAGLGGGVSYALVSGDPSQVGRITGAVLVYLPAVLLVGAVAVALVGWAPRWAGAAWGVLAACFVVGWLGQILAFPDWVMEASPYSRTPQLPVEDLAATPLLVLSGLALGLVALGAVGLRRRDLTTG